MAELQDILFAQKKHSLLVILQGMDSSGKDGTVKHIFSGINPQGFIVTSFKKPSLEEEAHDFLWRVHQKTPPKGYISAFNRSHYEDVLVPRVHGGLKKDDLKRRFRYIRQFEEMLVEEGTTIIKLFLHISKEKQLKKIKERLEDPKKHWKFDASDLQEREFWDDYQEAYVDVFKESSIDKALVLDTSQSSMVPQLFGLIHRCKDTGESGSELSEAEYPHTRHIGAHFPASLIFG